MKKVLATAMALAMLASAVTINAGAVYSDGPNSFTPANTANNTGNLNVDPRPANHLDKAGVAATTAANGESVGQATVDIKVKTGDAGSTIHVYAVTYSVTELNFQYGNAADIIWNPETLKYETVPSSGSGWTNPSQDITVTNYSDLPIKVEATVQNKTDAGVTITPDSTLELESAAPTGSTAGTGTAKTGTISVEVSGAPTGSYTDGFTKIGELLLKVTNNVT